MTGTGRRVVENIRIRVATVTITDPATASLMKTGTSTKNAGSEVRALSTSGPAATRSAVRLPRQAMTVATRPITPSTLPRTRIA